MNQSSKDSAVADLKRRILSLDLPPGGDLDEAKLSDFYGISRTPLREMLQRLAGEGYIRLEANRGAKIASMDLATMRTFFQTAPMIYANISRLAAENRRGDQITALKEAQAAFKDATAREDASDAALANHRFHATIGEMADNIYLMACLERLLIDHTRLSQTFYRPAAPSEKVLILRAADQHDAMISAIEAREPALAIDLTLQHWDLSRDRVERFVSPDPLPVDVVSMERHRNAR